MDKKIVLSAKLDHDVIKDLIPKLEKRLKNTKLILHDPIRQFFNLEDLSKQFGTVDYFIVKVASECSIDLLHFAKLYNIPTLHNIDLVLLCKNKIALDQALRKILNKYSSDLNEFRMPRSWNQNLLNIQNFKHWAKTRLPIVLKSHYQHDKYNRFNFLVKEIDEIDSFCNKYSNFLYYDVYIQEFIECDGIERKIYVIGDKVFGIKRENPIYLFLREKPEQIDVTTIKREKLIVSENIVKLAKIISQELNLKIFGFDLVKPINQEGYYLIDLNDFPGLRGIENIESILADYFVDLLNL